MKRSDAEKAKVIELWRSGWKGSNISRLLKIPESTVSYILKDVKEKEAVFPEATPKKRQTKPAAQTKQTTATQRRNQAKDVQEKHQANVKQKKPANASQERPQQTKATQNGTRGKPAEKGPHAKAVQKRPQTKTEVKVETAPKRQTIRRSSEDREELLRLSAEGWTVSQIAAFMNFPVSTVFYIIKKARDNGTFPENVQTQQHASQKNGISNKQKGRQVTSSADQIDPHSGAQNVSHTSKMLGALKMKIQAVGDKPGPKSRQGTHTHPHNAKLQGAHKIKGRTQTTNNARHSAGQRAQAISHPGGVMAGPQVDAMATGTRPNSRQGRRIHSQKSKLPEGRREKGVPMKNYVSHSLDTRLEVLQRFEQGERECDIARTMGIGRSTIRAMRNSKVLRRLYKTATESSFQTYKTTTVGSFQRGARIEWEPTDMGIVDIGIGDVKEEVEVGTEEDMQEDVDGSLRVIPPKDVVTESMERLLKIWIDRQTSHGCVVRDGAILTKALSLWQFVYDGLSPREARNVEDDFKPSTAWLQQFKEASGLNAAPSFPSHSSLPALEAYTHQATPVHVSVGEPAPLYQRRGEGRDLEGHLSHRVSEGSVKEVSSLLGAKIELGGYTASQVINFAETRLCWKRLPPNTVIAVDSFTSQGPRASTDSFSLLLGANATGDLKLKPLLVYHQEKPYSLAGYIKEHLPVVWRTHPRGRLTAPLCQNYVVEYLSQRCREYAAQHSLENRFLLVLEASPTYPDSMDDWAENIEVIFLPPNSDSDNPSDAINDSLAAAPLQQAMGQGISSSFRLCYLRRVFEQLIRETDSSSDNYLSSVCDFWRAYSIRRALSNVKMAWDDVTPSTLNAAWRSVWPECVYDPLQQKPERVPSEVNEDAVVSLAHRAGFFLVGIQNVRDWKSSHDQEPHGRQSNAHQNSTENHKLERQYKEEEEEEDEGEDEDNGEFVKTLDVRSLQHALSLLEDTMAMLENNDPNVTRSCEARMLVEAGVKGYRELLATKKRKAQDYTLYVPSHKQPKL